LDETVPLEGLLESPAGGLLSWPRFDRGLAEGRLEGLRGLGVEAYVPRGEQRIGGVPVLGKGRVGVVFAAIFRGCVVAVKARRTDSDRASMEGEAGLLRMANGVGVGPRTLASSDDFIVMDLVEGEYLPDWLEGLGPGDGSLLRVVLGRLLGKARRLDSIGLDHGELVRPRRHVIVSGDEPRIIDFESASTVRRPSNVTSLSHFLFHGGGGAGIVGGFLRFGRGELVGALRAYKREPSEGSYIDVLRVVGLGVE